MKDLSVIVPARNEIFLGKTIENLLENLTANTEIIAILDGYTVPIPEIPKDPKVKIIGHTESMGQRAACNEAARLSQSKYLMKLDAHCSIAKGMDSVMLEDMQDSWTCVPTMRNLWAFDWKCPEGHTRYQGPSGPCTVCGKETAMDMKWIGKESPQSNSFCFDSEPHFQYFRDYSKRPEGCGQLTETMSLQGSCFMLTRDKWFELNICDEAFGSWGSQGIETAVKTWLSGGHVMVNHKTWYAHMFRTQGGDFGFPYPMSGSQVSHAKKTARRLFYKHKWDKAIYPLSWLVEKFWPVNGWTNEELNKLKETEDDKTTSHVTSHDKPTKGCIYYTDNRLNMRIARTVRKYIAASGLPITSVSLRPTNFGKNIVLNEPRSVLTMYKQILIGLESMAEDIIFFTEHDILYPPEYFTFIPSGKNTFYYNSNYWFLRLTDGLAIHYNVSPLSGLVVYRETAIKHFKERIAIIEKDGFSYNMGFEPFTHHRIKWDFWCNFELFESKYPCIDIAHEGNVTKKRWSQEQFRRKPKFWEETYDEIPGWGKIAKIKNELEGIKSKN